MKLLTLTPEAHAFAVAAIAVYALACGQIAGYVQMWWPRGAVPSFLALYVATMGAVAVAALAVLELPTLTGGSAGALALGIPVGIAAGVAAVRFDAIARRLARRRSRSTDGRLRWTPGYRADGAGTRIVSPSPGERAGSVSTLALLLAVAALEEVLFRGVLVDLSLMLRNPVLAAACLTGTLAVFALSHVYWGWAEVLSKAALGVLALIPVLGLGTVVPAVLTHAVVNANAWVATRADARSSTATVGGAEPVARIR